jgi:hypothetical protein
MSRKKSSPDNALKDFLSALPRLMIVITVFLGGNDYQITTVIQLNASHHEESNHRLMVEHQSSCVQTTNIWWPNIIWPLSRIT